MSQKKRFPFLCLKYAACSFIAGKICFGLFAVKLGCFQCYCTGKRLSASLQRVTLILLDLTQNNVFVCFRLRYAVFSIVFLRTGFSFFSQLNFVFDPQKQSENLFWFVGSEIESFELYVRKSSNLVFSRKVRYFKLHNTENMFWLVGTKLGSLSFISQKTAILVFVC